MALTYNSRVRDLDIKGVITLNDGTQKTLTAANIVSYNINQGTGSSGIPFGAAEASTFDLVINKLDSSGNKYNLSKLDNANVHMEVGISSNGGTTYTYTVFGEWYVVSVDAPEQSTTITLNGYDSLATRFAAEYTDSSSAYPTTLGSLLTTMCTAAGVTLHSSTFPNSSVTVTTMPEWHDGVTTRDIVGYIAACAGGFAHIRFDGKLEICSWVDGTTYSIDSDLYKTFTPSGGSPFTFNCIEAKLTEDAEDYTRYAINSSIADNATNTIQLEGNPLLTETIIQSLLTDYTGFSVYGASLEWGGDPFVKLADKFTVTAMDNSTTTFIVNSQSFSFDGGMSATESGEMPTLSDQNGSTYSTTGNVMTSDGRIMASRLAGLDGSVISATKGHFEELTATTAKTDSLLASIIQATKLKADGIEAASVTTDIITAQFASIINATIRKLNAGTITADSLTASIASIINFCAQKIQAQEIVTDTLEAAIVNAQRITAEYADFSAASIKHLVSNVFNVEDAVGNDVFITNLRVAYAQLVTATIGTLVIKASDNKYYRLDVLNDVLTPVDVTSTTTQSEINAGKTEDGHAIIETDMTVADLAANNFKALMAVINKIYAEFIDVDKLFARQAFIDQLNTTDIRSNTYIQLMVGETKREASQWRVIVTSTDSDCVLIGTGSTTLSARLYYGAEDLTNSVSASLFSWTRSSGDSAADAAWNAAHTGMKSVTVSAGEASYNAVYECSADNGSITAALGTGRLGTMRLGIGA